MRLLALVAMLLPGTAMAQAYQCTVPRMLEPVPRIVPEGPARSVPAAGYTLAASWSPDYCKTRGDRTSMQCSGRNGRFGFVLHGLWPEAAKGPPPQWCATGTTPSPRVVRDSLCMTPSPRLLAHEWAKHGSCMAKTPDAYFRASAILWRSLSWPDADRLSRDKLLTVGHLRRAFVAANPAWRPDQVGVEISRTGWLREIRLCYSRRFLPARCDKRRFGPPDSAPLKIWRGL